MLPRQPYIPLLWSNLISAHKSAPLGLLDFSVFLYIFTETFTFVLVFAYNNSSESAKLLFWYIRMIDLTNCSNLDKLAISKNRQYTQNKTKDRLLIDLAFANNIAYKIFLGIVKQVFWEINIV